MVFAESFLIGNRAPNSSCCLCECVRSSKLIVEFILYSTPFHIANTCARVCVFAYLTCSAKHMNCGNTKQNDGSVHRVLLVLLQHTVFISRSVHAVAVVVVSGCVCWCVCAGPKLMHNYSDDTYTHARARPDVRVDRTVNF